MQLSESTTSSTLLLPTIRVLGLNTDEDGVEDDDEDDGDNVTG